MRRRRRLSTAREVVDALGGIAAVCKLTGAQPKAAYHWTGQAEMFPARTYCLMQDELKRRRAIAPRQLWNMMEKKTAA
jgi:hypothetical protein